MRSIQRKHLRERSGYRKGNMRRVLKDEEADTKQTILMQFIERPEVPEDTDEPEGMDG